jgi:transcriptional regulator with XRE-family HTH domain
MLDDLITKAGLTREQVYTRSGVSRAALYNWLAGRSQPQDEQAEALARILGCEPNNVNPWYGYCRNQLHFKPSRVKRGTVWVCEPCDNATQLRHRPRKAQTGQVRRRELKARVVDKYGGKCVCCEETCLGFLTIDHTDNNGHAERSATFYAQLDRESRRKDLEVMCFNCNCGRAANGGVCPHRAVGGWPFGKDET